MKISGTSRKKVLKIADIMKRKSFPSFSFFFFYSEKLEKKRKTAQNPKRDQERKKKSQVTSIY